MKAIIFLLVLVFIFSGCSKKATVATYSNVNVPIKHLKYVHLNIEGSDLFIQKLQERIPLMFLGQEILVDDPSSLDILHIRENSLQRSTDVEDSQETKEVKYITRIYNSDSKKYETKIIYVDRVYYKRCWIDKFQLSSSVITRYKKDTIISKIVKENCKTQRYDIFYKPSKKYDENTIYQQLVSSLRDKIINYLVPYTVYYDIKLEEDLDVKVSLKDEESFKFILEQIDNGIPLPKMLDELEVLNMKYPNSYTIYFTMGILYEIFAEYEKALVSYEKAFGIKSDKKVLERIKKVKANSLNLEKIKG